MADTTTYTVTVPANTVMILVPPVSRPTRVTVTCGFGAAVVEITTRENADDSSFAALPALSVPWPKDLKVGEGLYCRSDLNVRVPVVLAEV